MLEQRDALLKEAEKIAEEYCVAFSCDIGYYTPESITKWSSFEENDWEEFEGFTFPDENPGWRHSALC